MPANYARILRPTAAVTAAVGLVMVAMSAVVAGGKGLLGALAAIVLVAVFFAASVVAVGRAARVSAQAMMVTALVTYLVKILALAFLVSRLAGTHVFDTRLFGLTAIACILVYSCSQVVVASRLKLPIFESSGDR